MRNPLKIFLLLLMLGVGSVLTSCVTPGYTVVERRPPVIVGPPPVIVQPRPYYRPRYYRPAPRPRPYYGPHYRPAPRGRVIVVR